MGALFLSWSSPTSCSAKVAFASGARDYVDVRLGGDARRSHRSHPAPLRGASSQLWTQAVAAAAQDPRSVPIGLFIQSLNELIDLHSTRVMFALRSRLPAPVWIVLFTVGLLSFFTMGYQAGLTRSRSPIGIRRRIHVRCSHLARRRPGQTGRRIPSRESGAAGRGAPHDGQTLADHRPTIISAGAILFERCRWGRGQATPQ